MQLEHVFITEAAKKVQGMEFNKSNGPPDDPRNKVFWVVYCLEKNLTFGGGRGSVGQHKVVH
jgi:hypothetical protein